MSPRNGYIPAIIDFIQKLIDKGSAYQAGGDVYFALLPCADYGKLSSKNRRFICSMRVMYGNKRKPSDLHMESEPAGDFADPWVMVDLAGILMFSIAYMHLVNILNSW